MHILSRIRHCLERHEKRYPTFEAVEIMTKEGSLMGRATLRDISKSGAFLQINGMPAFPERIKVRIPKLEQTVGASVVWRNSREMGVRFHRHVSLTMFSVRSERRQEQLANYLTQHRQTGARSPSSHRSAVPAT